MLAVIGIVQEGETTPLLGTDERMAARMEGYNDDSPTPNVHGEQHLVVDIPETAHQISHGTLSLSLSLHFGSIFKFVSGTVCTCV